MEESLSPFECSYHLSIFDFIVVYTVILFIEIVIIFFFDTNTLSLLLLFVIGDCEIGSYGVDCSETCGHCLDVRQCSNSNGICLKGCDAGYQGAICKTREYMFFIWCKPNLIRVREKFTYPSSQKVVAANHTWSVYIIYILIAKTSLREPVFLLLIFN